jgi:hypothetical protein
MNEWVSKKKKPESKLDEIKKIVEILAGIANIILVIHQLLKG